MEKRGEISEFPRLLTDKEVEQLIMAIVSGSEEPIERRELLRRADVLGDWAEGVRRESVMLRLILDGRVVIRFKDDDDDFLYVPVGDFKRTLDDQEHHQ